MQGFEQVLEWVNVVAFVALAVLTFVQWRKRKDGPSFWAFLTFLDLGAISIAGRILEQFEGQESLALDVAVKVLIAVLLLFPYSLYRIAHSFSPGARFSHWSAVSLTGITIVWSLVLPRLPQEGDPQPTWFRIFVFAILIQWVWCSVLVATRFWRAGTDQPSVTRKRMRMLSIASTLLSVAIVISAFSPPDREVELDLVIQLFVVVSVAAFYFAFAPPTWLRSLWRRDSEEDSRRAIIDLMGAVTDEAVVEVLLPHAAALIGAEGVAMLDPDNRLIGSHNLHPDTWMGRDLEDEEGLRDASLVRFAFPFGCLLVKTTPYTLFFGRDEIELLQALGVMTNLALERVRASEMRLEIAETQLRRQQALEINDNVVQGLAVAKYAFDLGDEAKAKSAIEGTLAAARRIISDLLEEVSTDDVFGAQALTRDAAATGFLTKDQ